VQREDVKRFKAVLERVPRGTPAAVDVSAYVTADAPERPLARATVTKSLGRVAAFFSWALDREWIEKSPAVGMLEEKKRGREVQGLREPFTVEKLGRVFGPEFAAQRTASPARFWVPVLALYTGARRGVLAQLFVGDGRRAGSSST
jgi:site-specific recombinase XerD